MIPEIGFMMGAYIITRCVGMMGNYHNPFTQLLAVLTILVAGFVSFDLLVGGAVNTLQPPQ